MAEALKQDPELRKLMVEMMKESGEPQAEAAVDAMWQAIAGGARIADVLGISKETLEAGYAYGYNLYSAGNFQDAAVMFRGLCIYDPDDPRYWMGLGGCLQACGNYDKAIDVYGMAGVAGAMQDPAPFYHGGICCLKKGDAEGARVSLETALTLGKESNPAHKACHEKIRGLLASLKEAQKEARA